VNHAVQPGILGPEEKLDAWNLDVAGLAFIFSPSTLDLWWFVMGAALKHYLNPLHVYCRLRDLGMTKGVAVSLCKLYERMVSGPLDSA